MKFGLFLFAATIIAFTSGCSLFYSTPKPTISKPIYDAPSNALEDDYFHSPVGDVAGHYPKQWLQTNIEHVSELENLGFVYTNPDRTWALTLEEIPGSADLRRRYEKDGLLSVAEESINLRRKKTSEFQISRAPELFTQNSMQFANYEIVRKASDSSYHSRYVLFTTGIRFYEIGISELSQNARNSANNGYLANYELLQAVISSLEGVPSGK
ncbi:MAG TPA: hypothetical protein VEW28_02370 [Candidatus Kapabacteria bacterium]|nr:hypothetical protein [Candidatus Kapabacteria bacterium]